MSVCIVAKYSYRFQRLRVCSKESCAQGHALYTRCMHKGYHQRHTSTTGAGRGPSLDGYAARNRRQRPQVSRHEMENSLFHHDAQWGTTHGARCMMLMRRGHPPDPLTHPHARAKVEGEGKGRAHRVHHSFWVSDSKQLR